MTLREPSVEVRGYADGDIPAMVDVYNQNCIAENDLNVINIEHLERQHAHTPNIEADTVCALVDGRLVAYGRISQRTLLDGDRVYFHFIRQLPEYGQRAVLQPMLDWQFDRMRAMHAALPAQDGQIWLQTRLADGNTSDYQPLIGELGYVPIRYSYEMTRDLTQPIEPMPLPAHLTTRPMTAADAPQVWAADLEAFRDHWGFSEPGPERYAAWLDDPNFQPHLWQVAWDGDEIAGMILNYVDADFNQAFNRLRGYTESISVRRPWRRQGVAAALLARSMQMFRDMGMTEAALGVDAQNPTGALRVYQSAGFEVIHEVQTYQRAYNL